MNHIYIEHNPFTVETLFKVNGEIPSESLSIQSYRHKRLQQWVEGIFFVLREIFNGAGSFYVEFKGVESDFIDLQEAAKCAEQSGMTIELEWQQVDPAESRLDEMKSLLDTLQNDPKFAQYIKNSGTDVEKNLKSAFDNEVDVYVLATMSSGKSTFINSMLGQDLLPTANEATTATIAHIIDDKTTGDSISGKRLSVYRDDFKEFDPVKRKSSILEENNEVNLDLLKDWNKDPETKTIELRGNIHGLEQNDNIQLVLTDTPGPNNSQDKEHKKTTIGFVQNNQRKPLILYILNGKNLCADDDKNLLNLISKEMSLGGKQSKDRFLFVVNKMDAFDPEKDEPIEDVLGRTRKYLQDNGIDEPNIFPVCAQFAYLLRTQSQLTTMEEFQKKFWEDVFVKQPSKNLPMYTTMPAKVVNDMRSKTSSEALLRSGLPAVEATINEYINKYAFPLRLTRAHEALSKVVNEGLREAGLIEKIELDQQKLDELHHDIVELKKRRDIGFNTQAYKEKVKQEGHALPVNVQHELDELEAQNYQLIRRLGDEFEGDALIDQAHDRLKSAADDVEFAFMKTINNYEHAFNSSQELIKEQLYQEYQQHIASLFPDSKTLELPAFKILKDSISAISLEIDLQQEEIQNRVVVSGYRTVSTSKWYNPFSWGSSKQVTEYKTEEYVDLQDIWKERLPQIRTSFNGLKEAALGRIIGDKDKLVENYLSFMDREFMGRFDELLNNLENKMQNSDQLKAAIDEAKKERHRIEKIKQDIANILQL